MKAKHIQTQLRSLSNPDVAQRSRRYFKTGEGEYGEGDKFLGVRMPALRAEIKQCADMPLVENAKLLKSSYHEERQFALLVLVHQYSKADDQGRKKIYELYLKNTTYINSWDLVDSSAYKIVGEYLKAKNRKPLYVLAKSCNLWKRRIAIISTLRFIKDSDFTDTLKISEFLLNDEEDLIQKAVGWMLREVGNRDRKVEETFLQIHYRNMPRTMLRYAIEKFPEKRRKLYLEDRLHLPEYTR